LIKGGCARNVTWYNRKYTLGNKSISYCIKC